MNENLQKIVRSAAVAGWLTVLVAMAVVTSQWLAYLAVMSAKPAWVLSLWGPDLTWATVQTVWLWAITVIKMFVLALAMLALWLTLWSRRLRQG